LKLATNSIFCSLLFTSEDVPVSTTNLVVVILLLNYTYYRTDIACLHPFVTTAPSKLKLTNDIISKLENSMSRMNFFAANDGIALAYQDVGSESLPPLILVWQPIDL
jgi:hypothetical protein